MKYKHTQPMLSRSTVLDIVPFGKPDLNAGLFALRLTPPAWPAWNPGQFIMVRSVGGGSDTPWARPFTICRLAAHNLVIFFQVTGRVTAQMARLKPGDEVDIWGPLGNAFSMEPENQTLIVAGGIGIAPFVSYVQEHPAPWNISMLFGHRLPIECYPFDSLNEKIIADSFNDKSPEDIQTFIGMIDKRVADLAATTSGKGLMLACGPLPLLRSVQSIAVKYKVRTQLSLETRMTCGVGACLGCVVKVIPPSQKELGAEAQTRLAQTCTSGPNFWADSVVL